MRFPAADTDRLTAALAPVTAGDVASEDADYSAAIAYIATAEGTAAAMAERACDRCGLDFAACPVEILDAAEKRAAELIADAADASQIMWHPVTGGRAASFPGIFAFAGDSGLWSICLRGPAVRTQLAAGDGGEDACERALAAIRRTHRTALAALDAAYNAANDAHSSIYRARTSKGSEKARNLERQQRAIVEEIAGRIRTKEI